MLIIDGVVVKSAYEVEGRVEKALGESELKTKQLRKLTAVVTKRLIFYITAQSKVGIMDIPEVDEFEPAQQGGGNQWVFGSWESAIKFAEAEAHTAAEQRQEAQDRAYELKQRQKGKQESALPSSVNNNSSSAPMLFSSSAAHAAALVTVRTEALTSHDLKVLDIRSSTGRWATVEAYVDDLFNHILAAPAMLTAEFKLDLKRAVDLVDEVLQKLKETETGPDSATSRKQRKHAPLQGLMGTIYKMLGEYIDKASKFTAKPEAWADPSVWKRSCKNLAEAFTARGVYLINKASEKSEMHWGSTPAHM